MKTCSNCLSVKEESNFYKGMNQCRVCIREKQRAYDSKNKEKIRGAKQQWQRLNAAEISQKKKDYYRNNLTMILEKDKVYKSLNKEKRRLRDAIRRKEDLGFKIEENLRSRMRTAFRLSGNKKVGKTVELLGCSFSDFKIHIEKQFKDGMSWDNYGLKGWHIDHIKPCCTFNLLDNKQQKECFHYTNLQPLWAKDNYAKKSIV